VDPSVSLTVRAGGAAEVHTFTRRTTCLVGRADECGIRLDRGESKVSRHHCLLDVNPPRVTVRDLGSRNGTYVNETPLRGAQAARELADGDEIRLGGAVLRVAVTGAAPADGPDPARDTASARGEDAVRATHTLMAAAEAGDPALAPIRGYRVLQELGRGGQGVVHLVRREETGELLALKTLLARGWVSGPARDGFLREFACTQALRHRNVVAFHGGGAHGDTFYFTCEFCRMGSVADMVAAAGGRVSVRRAVAVALQTLRGLDYTHRAPVPVRLPDGTSTVRDGLVHRDIKPQNLLLTRSQEGTVVKIADFGLAKAFDSAGLSGHTQTGAMGGSVAFMPRGQVIDFKYVRPEVDLWAVMACLYWMLTGAAPRDFPPGADPVTVVLHEPPVPVRDRLPSLPHRLAELIDATLVDRPRIASTTASDLSQRDPAGGGPDRVPGPVVGSPGGMSPPGSHGTVRCLSLAPRGRN
jgi:serine/threonine protein kinase